MLVVLALGHLNDHFLKPIVGLGDDDAKSITRALNEAVEALGALSDQALGITQAMQCELKRIGKVPGRPIAVSGRFRQTSLENTAKHIRNHNELPDVRHWLMLV